MISILHHLGLGDAIMLNGMIRHFAEKEDMVVIFVRKHQIPSVSFMYRDLKNVKIVPVFSTHPREMWTRTEGRILALATYGIHDDLWKLATSGPLNVLVNWAHSVYIQAGIPPKYMYSKFKVIRDKDKEIKYNHNNYIFIHDDSERGMNINVSHENIFRITKDRLKNNPNIFDYLSVIENAKEVHCMDSCYAWLINLMEIGTPAKNFLHLNVKGNYNTQMVKTVFGDDIWTHV